MTGTIRTVNSDRGFFFIKGSDGKQYFAHVSALKDKTWMYELAEDDAVSFDSTDAPKGPRAENIVVNRLNG